MSEGIYRLELCCDGQVLETRYARPQPGVEVKITPRRALERWLEAGEVMLLNPEEDYFQVTDPCGGVWFWGYRDGKLVRLLRPPVSRGSE